MSLTSSYSRALASVLLVSPFRLAADSIAHLWPHEAKIGRGAGAIAVGVLLILFAIVLSRKMARAPQTGTSARPQWQAPLGWMRVLVTSGHYRDRTFVPVGTVLDLPTDQVQAMLRGGTGRLVPIKPDVEKPSRSGKFKKLRSIFARARGTSAKLRVFW